MRAILLVSTWNHELQSTRPRGSSIAQLKVSPPGRMMIRVPTKPPLTRSQRKGETLSPSDVDASSVMTRGVIITMAVNSPTGR